MSTLGDDKSSLLASTTSSPNVDSEIESSTESKTTASYEVTLDSKVSAGASDHQDNTSDGDSDALSESGVSDSADRAHLDESEAHEKSESHDARQDHSAQDAQQDHIAHEARQDHSTKDVPAGHGEDVADGATAALGASTKAVGQVQKGYVKEQLFYGKWVREGETYFPKKRSALEVWPKPYPNMKLHVCWVFLFLVLLLIPIISVKFYASDRESAQFLVYERLAQGRSGQSVSDPVIALNYLMVRKMENEDGSISLEPQEKVLYIGADRVKSDLEFKVERKFDGPFFVDIYDTKVKLKGSFNVGRVLKRLKSFSEIRDVYFDSMRLLVPIRNLSGVVEVSTFKLNDNNLSSYGKEEDVDYFNHDGFIVGKNIRSLGRIDFSDDNIWNFDISFKLNGASRFSYLTSASNLNLSLKGVGSLPSVTSSYDAKVQQYDEAAKSFVLGYSTENVGVASATYNSQSLFNVTQRILLDFDSAPSPYALVDRLCNLIIMVVGILTVIMLVVELVYKRFMSLSQYALIDVTFALFLLLLLSLCEHLNHLPAYLISASIVTIMVSLYVKSSLESIKAGVLVFLTLFAGFSVLLALINLESYALLIGTMVLVFILSLIMYITRDLNNRRSKGRID